MIPAWPYYRQIGFPLHLLDILVNRARNELSVLEDGGVEEGPVAAVSARVNLAGRDHADGSVLVLILHDERTSVVVLEMRKEKEFETSQNIE